MTRRRRSGSGVVAFRWLADVGMGNRSLASRNPSAWRHSTASGTWMVCQPSPDRAKPLEKEIHMRRPLIPLDVHAAIEPFMALLLIASPWIFGFSDASDAKTVVIVVGIVMLLAGSMTRWRLSL